MKIKQGILLQMALLTTIPEDEEKHKTIHKGPKLIMK